MDRVPWPGGERKEVIATSPQHTAHAKHQELTSTSWRNASRSLSCWNHVKYRVVAAADQSAFH